MPRLAIDYVKNFNYKIVCKDLTITESYAGSSTHWPHRKSSHKSDCHNENSPRYILKVYQFIRAHGGWDNWEMILIEYFPCKTQLEQAQRERYWIETLKATLNCNIPSRTDAEYVVDNKEHIEKYRFDNKEHISEQRAVYRDTHREQRVNYDEENKEHIAELRALRYEATKEIVLIQKAVPYTCPCGAVCSTGGKARHEKTAKHKKYMLTL